MIEIAITCLTLEDYKSHVQYAVLQSGGTQLISNDVLVCCIKISFPPVSGRSKLRF